MAKKSANRRQSAESKSDGPSFDAVFQEALNIAFQRTGKGKNAGKPVISLQLREVNGNAKRTKWSLYRWLSRVYVMFKMEPNVTDMLARIKALKDGDTARHKIAGDDQNGWAIYRPGYSGAGNSGAKVQEQLDDDMSKLRAKFGITE